MLFPSDEESSEPDLLEYDRGCLDLIRMGLQKYGSTASWFSVVVACGMNCHDSKSVSLVFMLVFGGVFYVSIWCCLCWSYFWNIPPTIIMYSSRIYMSGLYLFSFEFPQPVAEISC